MSQGAKPEPDSGSAGDTPVAADLTMAARWSCLNTTELLEAILKHLDTKTLLFSQRVNRRFRDVIQRSRPLRQRLFLEPATAAEILEADFKPNQSATPYILVTSSEEAGLEKLPARELERRTHDDKYTRLAVLNPLLFDDPFRHDGKVWPAQTHIYRREYGYIHLRVPLSRPSSLQQT